MRPGSSHRAAGLALVALFVLGQATLFAHQLLVPHRACAEHGGELIHVASGRAGPVAEAPAWVLAQPQGAPHSHDHCVAFTSRRLDAVAAVEPCDLPVRAECPAVRVPELRPVCVSRGLRLRLAPKSSPPV